MPISIPTSGGDCDAESRRSIFGMLPRQFPDGIPDSEVLRVAADAGRDLVTRDVRTMRVHFQEFVAERNSPGVLLVPSSRSTGAAIEGLLIVWLTWTPEDLRNQVRWLP
jgi:hypothetical protein